MKVIGEVGVYMLIHGMAKVFVVCPLLHQDYTYLIEVLQKYGVKLMGSIG